MDPLRHQLPDSQPRLRQGLRVGAAVAVHVVAVRGAVDVDGRRLGRDVLQHSHRVPRVDRAVDKHDIVNVRVHTSISEEFVRRWYDNIFKDVKEKNILIDHLLNVGSINIFLQNLMSEGGSESVLGIKRYNSYYSRLPRETIQNAILR